MPVLSLSPPDQRALRALLAAEPDAGASVPWALERVVELVPCDRVDVTVLAGDGAVVDEHALRVAGGPAGRGGSGADGGELLAVFDQGDGGAVRLRLSRRDHPFSERDRALLHLVAPVLERLLRERSATRAPTTLTVTERRVLQQVAAGLSNAGIAERLFVAPSTVRKHLEHSYRKLGVTSRMAALASLGGLDATAMDPRERPVETR
ncbi:regulatory protein, luxR family [Friedmanniella luteola]|uniref:Regulatory protein, luxR family n=1 Tax=Friedmanniella luteola TaxID=546871 RepID=A0A1H1TE87_9ACTN|nr:helix-turn-helix transcriptional regulator [Friedmanniella luteola]SDS58454.1 regulatory protein, luxR family [Friedmanniella luteola]